MTPTELLDAARKMSEIERGTWTRTSAHLARQALERAVAREIMQFGAIPENISFEAQFLALEGTPVDVELAREAAWTWAALSQACHHHAYELPPTQGELTRWIESAGRFVGATG